MKREIIYTTKQSVRNTLHATQGAQPSTVWLLGAVERHTERKLLGFIPLPNRYVWSIVMVEEIETKKGTKSRLPKEDSLTFDSRKRLSEARLAMEKLLRHKCKEYKERDKAYGYHG